MAAKGTPYQGRDLVIAPRVYTALQLVLYTNAQDSLGDASTFATLVQPAGSGYAPIALSGVWTSVNGVITYDHGTPDDPSWVNTHATNNWSLPVTGVAMIDGASHLLHYMDLPAGPMTMSPGKRITVNVSTLTAP